jgi:predicted neuraminidase
VAPFVVLIVCVVFSTLAGTPTKVLPGSLHQPAPRIQDAPPKSYVREALLVPGDAYPSIHGSSVVELDNGELLITWFAGSRERAPDTQIYSMRYSTSSNTYAPANVVVRRNEKAEGAFWADKTVGNTILYQDDDKILWLFYNAVMVRSGWSGALINYVTSHDNGRNWSPPKRFATVIGNLVKNPPLRLSSNSFLVPCYTEFLSHKSYVCKVTHENGKIVAKSCDAQVPAEGLIQPALVRTKSADIVMTLRDRSKQGVHLSRSLDGGETWSNPAQVGLPNPDSAIATITLDDGRILLAYNHSSEKRTPLSLAVSEDNGRSFMRMRDVEDGSGEFSYPSLLQSRDALIHLIYTYKRGQQRTLKHITFDRDWLQPR